MSRLKWELSYFSTWLFPSPLSSLSKEFEAMSRRNVELERTLAEVEGALQGKEAAVRNHIDRAQKAEFAALSAKRECVIAEEKVSLFHFGLLLHSLLKVASTCEWCGNLTGAGL